MLKCHRLTQTPQLSEFRCANGEKCIQQYQKCNHRAECSDGSDEQDCSEFTIIPSPNPLHSHVMNIICQIFNSI